MKYCNLCQNIRNEKLPVKKLNWSCDTFFMSLHLPFWRAHLFMVLSFSFSFQPQYGRHNDYDNFVRSKHMSSTSFK